MQKYTLLLISVLLSTPFVHAKRNTSSTKSSSLSYPAAFSISITTNSISRKYQAETAQEVINMIQDDMKSSAEIEQDENVKNFLKSIIKKLKSPGLTSYSENYYYKSTSASYPKK